MAMIKNNPKGAQAFPFDYSCKIENGIFSIELYIPEKPDDLRIEYIFYGKVEKWEKIQVVKESMDLSTSFEIKKFATYFVRVTLKSDGKKFVFDTTRHGLGHENAFSYLTLDNYKHFERFKSNLGLWYEEYFEESARQSNIVDPLINFRNANPNVYIIVYNTQSLPVENCTEHEQKILDNVDGYGKIRMIRNAMLENPPRIISRAWDGLGYERPEFIVDCITHSNYRPYINEQGVFTADADPTPFCNLLHGHRVTHHQPRKSDQTLWHIGYSHVFGVGAPDWGTISSFLQKILNERIKSKTIRIENYGYTRMGGRGDQAMKIANSLSSNFRDNDIVVLNFLSVFDFPSIRDVLNCDISQIFQRPHDYGECFFDKSHVNETGNRVIAEHLYDFMLENKVFEIDRGLGARQKRQPDTGLPKEQIEPLNQYLDQIAPLRPRIGAIVMNCNPFTLGHRHLIEQSAAKVTRLFIFVVEEDKSVFPFADRMELVRHGTSGLKNVEIIPSGKFIISTLTFADYFGKTGILQDRTIDPSMDVKLFGQYIAPKLGINVRFAGEEPLDYVTRQYNEAMARILPEYEIDFEVIPRKECDGEVISASRVRKLLMKQNFSELAKLVPASTLNYLVEDGFNAMLRAGGGAECFG